MKECSICNQKKPAVSFYTYSGNHCKECCRKRAEKWNTLNKKRHIANVRAYNKKYHKEHRAQIKQWYARVSKQPSFREDTYFRTIKRHYGISRQEYESLLATQGQGCAICSRRSHSHKHLAVDHCHTSGKVRGLLCKDCNTALGLFQDDPSRLVRASWYLRKGKI
jgi:hypothetical protein